MAKNNIATAYVQILPTTEGIKELLKSALKEPMDEVAAEIGLSGGNTLGGALSTSLQKAIKSVDTSALVGSMADIGEGLEVGVEAISAHTQEVVQNCEALQTVMTKVSDAASDEGKTIEDGLEPIPKITGKVRENIDELGEKFKESEKPPRKFGEAVRESLKKINKGFEDTGKKSKIFADVLKANLTSKLIEFGLKAFTNAVKGISTAIVGGYADYEQLLGGVDKLFGAASDAVLQHAEEAYRTAGLSANQYMEAVTGFSASLISGLGGDTEEAARVADIAIQDMADNANTFGTDMASVQAAYQGFAKQNYTMLDNLNTMGALAA